MDECKSPKAYSPPLSLPFPRKKIEEKRHAGGELFATISRRGRLPESIARRYFQQLVFALRFYHRSGVAHYDLKPQNLLLDDEGNLKVSDRSKADVWSCGLILYVFLAGYFPFDDTNIPAMYKKISQRDYQFPDWISKPARYVIYKLLDLDPETRMDLEALFRNPWFKKSLNLTRLFETTSDGGSRREKRFTSSAHVEVVEEKLKEVGGVLGFKVEAGKAINGVRGGRRRQCGSDLSGMARTVQ